MQNIPRRRILVTGGSSFLGGYLVKMAQSGFLVSGTYHKNHPQYPEIQWLRFDLDQQEELKSRIYDLKPDIIILNAAYTDVDWCEQNKEAAEKVNIRSSGFISRIAGEIGARIVYISTDLVFDGQNPPYDEKDTPRPTSHYGWTKWQGELSVAEHNNDHVIIRPAIMYGPPAISGTSFSEWMIRTWKAGEKTHLFADQYRTPIFVANLAKAILELARCDFRGLIHIGGAERINRWEFGMRLANEIGMDTGLIEKSTMEKANLVGKRPADVSFDSTLAGSMIQTKLLDCTEGIRLAYTRREHGA